MSQTTSTFDIRHFLSETLCSVFDTMLALKVTVTQTPSAPHFAERVTSAVGFAGERATGAVYIHLSAAFARKAAGLMLGMPPEEIEDERTVNDVIGELGNMVTGALKSRLCDEGTPCAVSTPAIIRGSSFEVEVVPEVRRELLIFECAEDHLALELHIKYQ